MPSAHADRVRLHPTMAARALPAQVRLLHNRSLLTLTVFLALGLLSKPGLGQATSKASPDEQKSGSLAPIDTLALAKKYAPKLWFSDQEKYFPTIPFFTAFDSIDNDGDGLVDFLDADEIAWSEPDSFERGSKLERVSKEILWSDLNTD